MPQKKPIEMPQKSRFALLYRNKKVTLCSNNIGLRVNQNQHNFGFNFQNPCFIIPPFFNAASLVSYCPKLPPSMISASNFLPSTSLGSHNNHGQSLIECRVGIANTSCRTYITAAAKLISYSIPQRFRRCFRSLSESEETSDLS